MSHETRVNETHGAQLNTVRHQYTTPLVRVGTITGVASWLVGGGVGVTAQASVHQIARLPGTSSTVRCLSSVLPQTLHPDLSWCPPTKSHTRPMCASDAQI